MTNQIQELFFLYSVQMIDGTVVEGLTKLNLHLNQSHINHKRENLFLVEFQRNAFKYFLKKTCF